MPRRQFVDRALVGAWRCLPFDQGPDSEAATFVVKAVDDYHYQITFDVDGDKTQENHRAYASLIKSRPVLNVHMPDSKQPSKAWALARYSFLRHDVVEVQLVDDGNLKDADRSSQTLRRALEKAKASAGVYGDYCVCVRANDETASE